MNINNLGDWAIDVECYNKILEILPFGSTILEFGSGSGSEELSKKYIVYSIEHDINWLNKYNTNYIYAPLKPLKQVNTINWYDIEILKKELPNKYDLILIDGPPAPTSPKRNGRNGFLLNLDLFNIENKIIIFDDVHRKEDFDNFMSFANLTKKDYEIYNSGKENPKKFAVVF